ncbi:DUF2690 domain-containing protein [Microbacterium album]|uniref:DUF2690 domain-containing protein n=1 Tax=Microbacterium album TaxID=2053191 RepID=UPI00166C1A78|nr:DUF2690 domain-containing protein [Microbacterium album]
MDGIVRICTGEPHVWIDRRDALAGMTAREAADPAVPTTVPDDEEPGDAAVTPPAARPMRRRTAILLAAATFVLGSATTGTAAALVTSHLHQEQIRALTPPTAPRIAVQTGQDPAHTECVDDASVATGDTRADNSLLEIVWSNKCYAGWGRITRYDGLYQGNTVTIAIYPQTAPNGPDRQEATEHDVQGAYTTLVVRPSPDTLLCAEGSFTVDGKRIDLGDPICI